MLNIVSVSKSLIGCWFYSVCNSQDLQRLNFFQMFINGLTESFLCFLNKCIHSKDKCTRSADIQWNASAWLCFVHIKVCVWPFSQVIFSSICLSLDYNVPHMNVHQKTFKEVESISFIIMREQSVKNLDQG